MKCHAGVEFPSGKPCPECGAKLGEVCWPGINADLQELNRLRAAAKAVCNHWAEFGPEHGFDETMDGLYRASIARDVQ